MNHVEYFFIGIGGVGMSALAHILLEMNMKVAGSDLSCSKKTELLQKKGAKIFSEHSANHIMPYHIVIYSTAIKENNPELKKAKELGCLLWHRADLLKWLARSQKSLVVCGAHGKTTTTSLLAHVFYTAGKDPSFVFGGQSPSFVTNGHHGRGEHFILEGDESDGSFLKTDPIGAIVTNIDNDHLDYWHTKQNLCEAFISFMLKVQNKNHLVWWADDPYLSLIKPQGISYGFSKKAEAQIKQAKWIDGRAKFDIEWKGQLFPHIDLNLAGEHNVLNAAAVFVLAQTFGISERDIRLSFSTYRGVHRRLEKKGECQGAFIFDDYAHHPAEIVASLKAMRTLSPQKKLYAIFQPHRYTRMKAILKDFAYAFQDVDHLIVTDIYAGGEDPIEGINPDLIMKTIQLRQNQSMEYVKKSHICDYLKESLSKNDVVITLGAGDVYEVCDHLLVL